MASGKIWAGRQPSISESVSLVTCPFASFLHLETDLDRRDALSAIRAILRPRGRFVFDVFTPAEAGDPARDADWIERAPEIWEKNELDRRQRVIHVTLQHGGRATRLRFRWISREEWRRLFEDCGFTIYACYGWFDLRPCAQEGSHSVWVVERPA